MSGIERAAASAALVALMSLVYVLPAAGDVEYRLAESDPPANNEVYPYVPSVRYTGDDASALLPGIKSLTSPLPGWPENHDPYQFCSGLWNGARLACRQTAAARLLEPDRAHLARRVRRGR